jgi:hypothetical protein
MRLHSLRGDRFDLTVTATADTTVDGYETTHTSRVSLPLSAEQADAPGLARPLTSAPTCPVPAMPGPFPGTLMPPPGPPKGCPSSRRR